MELINMKENSSDAKGLSAKRDTAMTVKPKTKDFSCQYVFKPKYASKSFQIAPENQSVTGVSSQANL